MIGDKRLTAEDPALADDPDARRADAGAAEAIRVLLLAPAPAYASELVGVLAETRDAGRFRITPAPDLAAARQRLAAGDADVAVLTLPFPGERGVLPLPELCAAAPHVPVVVLAEPAAEPLAIKAVQLGAADYLLAGQLYGTLVARCLLYAVESERVRAQLSRRQEEWLPLLSAERATAVHAAPLRIAMPERFETLAREYRQLLDDAVAQLARRADLQLERSVRDLAHRAGELRAGARDVVEVHAHAMDALQGEHGPLRMKVYVAEGRVRLLELMGHLTNYYRDLSLAGQRHGPR